MKTKKHDTKWMVSVALMAAIVIVLANTPLGMIQLPIIKATTVHIPVILGAILLGPAAGAILGGVFGICSLISNTMAPTLLSFAFSPFMSTTGLTGAVKAICGQCSMGPCHGNRNSIRNPGSDCSSSACTRNWKSPAQCIQEDGYRNRTCRSGKINIIQNIIIRRQIFLSPYLCDRKSCLLK